MGLPGLAWARRRWRWAAAGLAEFAACASTSQALLNRAMNRAEQAAPQ